MRSRVLLAAVCVVGVACGEMPGTDAGSGGGSGGGATGGGGVVTGGGTGGGVSTGGGSPTGGGTATGGGGGGTVDSGVDAGDDVLTPAELALAHTFSPLPSVPADPTNAYADNAAAATLGQRLYFDKAYSGALAVGTDGGNGSLGDAGVRGLVACASCHESVNGADSRSIPNNVSIGTNFGTRNALGVVNASFNRWTNWGGRFDTQWSLPLAVAENPVNMASTRLEVVHVLFAKYRADYDAIFPTPLDSDLDLGAPDAGRFPSAGKPTDPTWEGMAAADKAIVNRAYANYGKALAAYMRKLISRGAKFDRFVAGERAALNASEKRGFQLFAGKGACTACHTGPTFSDGAFHALNVPQVGPHVPATDNGRFQDVAPLLASAFNSNGVFSDATDGGKLDGLAATDDLKGKFRTPQLRGLSSTAPYMHAGQLATLEAVVDFYDVGGGVSIDGGTQLPALALSAQEKTDLVAFLKTLDGEPVPAALLVDTSR